MVTVSAGWILNVRIMRIDVFFVRSLGELVITAVAADALLGGYRFGRLRGMAAFALDSACDMAIRKIMVFRGGNIQSQTGKDHKWKSSDQFVHRITHLFVVLFCHLHKRAPEIETVNPRAFQQPPYGRQYVRKRTLRHCW